MSRPVEAHASTLAGWWWCAHRCIQQLKGVYAPKSRALVYGRRLHDWLARSPIGPRLEWISRKLAKQKVTSRIRPGYFYHRMFNPNFDIYGDIDAFQLDQHGRFRIVEYKSIRNVSRIGRRWYESPYVFQVGIYAWILDEVLRKLRLELSDYHELIWFSSDTGFRAHGDLTEYPPIKVAYDRNDVESGLARIFEAYHDPSKIIYPEIDWKCRVCPDIYRDTCPKWRDMNG